MEILRCCAFFSFVPDTVVDVQEKRSLFKIWKRSLQQSRMVSQQLSEFQKKSENLCLFWNQELLIVFMILHSINSCTFNLQVFLIRREKVTLDLRGLSLSKGKKNCGGIWNMVCILKRVPGKIFVLAISIPTSSPRAHLEIISEKMWCVYFTQVSVY